MFLRSHSWSSPASLQPTRAPMSPRLTLGRLNGTIRDTWLVRASIVVWLTAVVTGFLWAIDYDVRPAAVLAAPEQWPADSRLERPSQAPTVLMFVHPKCPCTRASLAELARIKEQAGEALSVQLVLVDLPELKVDWKRSGVWPSIKAIKDAKLWFDSEGVEGRRFAAKASGYTLVYDAAGRLAFSGGITGARGHFGPNANSDTLAAVAVHPHVGAAASQVPSTPVFGCPLFDSSGDCCKVEKQ